MIESAPAILDAMPVFPFVRTTAANRVLHAAKTRHAMACGGGRGAAVGVEGVKGHGRCMPITARQAMACGEGIGLRVFRYCGEFCSCGEFCYCGGVSPCSAFRYCGEFCSCGDFCSCGGASPCGAFCCCGVFCCCEVICSRAALKRFGRPQPDSKPQVALPQSVTQRIARARHPEGKRTLKGSLPPAPKRQGKKRPKHRSRL